MSSFSLFQKRILLNYIIGSMIAVFGVGSVFIFHTLTLSFSEMVYLLVIMIISGIVMLASEFLMYSKHIQPVKLIYHSSSPSLAELESAFLTAHRFPMLTVKRILGPHLFGLSLPASILSMILIASGLLSLPYYYVWLAWGGAILIAVMHALIEFFLTYRSAQDIIQDISKKALRLQSTPLTIEGKYHLSIQRKLLVSALFTSVFPVLLFILAAQIRLTESNSTSLSSYWNWASIIVLVIFGLSLSGSILLYKSIEEPIQSLQTRFENVYMGDFKQMENTYSDEFAHLVSGFNHMVSGIQDRDERNEQLLESFFTVFAATLDARDAYTAGHSNRVAEYSIIIANEAGLPEDEVDLLRKSALLHDIGKIGVRDNVLLKDGKLTDEEFELIKKHPVMGANILEQVDLPDELQPLLPGVKYHHERFDGRGYPEGLSGYNIPKFGRLMAVADAFDAMTSDRPYRKGMPFEKALSIIEGGRGTQWDPYYADLFLNIMKQKITEPELSYSRIQ
ncbi:HD domain-containing protein [Pontibacillus yanchengensis]|uniref:HD domain-containing protein n=1 Tax=Pontibacillus yanchengensis TaxID=462910 RepID=A0A6I4ZTQ4_9BACI|nr:HD-GYP domain-containing protein [Pontibacillus yanchengensis]MYL33568.1 HD domain-containing protein [Pontibacillus yanchengensis]